VGTMRLGWSDHVTDRSSVAAPTSDAGHVDVSDAQANDYNYSCLRHRITITKTILQIPDSARCSVLSSDGLVSQLAYTLEISKSRKM